MTEPANRGRGWLLPMLVVVVSLGYGVATRRLGQPPITDYWEYAVTASRLLKHGTVISALIPGDDETAPSNLQPPAYTALVACVYAVLGDQTPASTLALQLINVLAAAGTVSLASSAARRLFGIRAGWCAGFVTAIHPNVFRFTMFIWDTSVFTCAVALSVWIAACWPADSKLNRRWVAYGLLLGALAHLNPSLTTSYPLLILWPASRVFGWRPGSLLRASTLALLGWAVAIAPWCLRNHTHFDRWSYIRGGLGLEFWLGFCPEADGTPAEAFHGCFALKNDAERQRAIALGEQAYYDDCMNRARLEMNADPRRVVRLISTRFVDYWTGNAWTGRVWERFHRSKAQVLGVLFFTLETVLLGCGLLLYARRRRELLWLAAILFTFSAVYWITHIMIRYRAPMEPVLAIALSLPLSLWAERLLGRKPGTSATV